MTKLSLELRGELERLRRLPPMRPASFYIWMIFGLSTIAMVSVLLVLVLRPVEDNTTVIVGILGFLSPVVLTVIAVMVKDVHTIINSRMDALLNATERAASAEGRAAGKAEGG